MTNPFIDMLRSWQNFYFMIGGAAAALMGLMFVALSLGTGLLNDDTRDEFSTFVTPSVVYFASVLLIAGAMLVPSYAPLALGVLLFVGGGVGLFRAVQHSRLLIRAANQYQDFNIWDWLAQVVAPVAGYGLILLAALGYGIDQWALAFMGLWLATLLLIICGIANTWSLVLWIIDQRTG
jgi:hypothetical protein